MTYNLQGQIPFPKFFFGFQNRHLSLFVYSRDSLFRCNASFCGEKEYAL